MREMDRRLTKGFVVLVAVAALPASASASTITVNGTGDTAANDGTCVLREAITAANTQAASGPAAGECAAGNGSLIVDEIRFALAGAGPHVISPATPLPAITQTVLLDGDSDTVPGPAADEIRVDGGGTVTTGLDVVSAGVTIDSIGVTRFSTVGIDLSGSLGAIVRESAIGTDAGGGGARQRRRNPVRLRRPGHHRGPDHRQPDLGEHDGGHRDLGRLQRACHHREPDRHQPGRNGGPRERAGGDRGGTGRRHRHRGRRARRREPDLRQRFGRCEIRLVQRGSRHGDRDRGQQDRHPDRRRERACE